MTPFELTLLLMWGIYPVIIDSDYFCEPDYGFVDSELTLRLYESTLAAKYRDVESVSVWQLTKGREIVRNALVNMNDLYNGLPHRERPTPFTMGGYPPRRKLSNKRKPKVKRWS